MESFPSTSSAIDEGDLLVPCPISTSTHEKKVPNGEKARSMTRLRRIIDEMNELFEENFVLTVVNPNTSKHVSFYGSRPVVKALYTSDFVEKLKENLPATDKASIYMPFTNIRKEPNEYMQSESQLYSKILRLLDLYNYPAREHFSYKSKGSRGCSPRPKPDYWPKDVKYGSLLCGNIAGLTEQNSTRIFENRKAMILLVLNGVRQHYRTFLKLMNGVKHAEEEPVDIEDVANYEELHAESSESKPDLVNMAHIDDKPSSSAMKLGSSVEGARDLPKCSPFKKARIVSRPIGVNESRPKRIVYPIGAVGRSPAVRQKWPNLSFDSHSRNIPRTRTRPIITHKDRVFTIDPSARNRWSQYDVRPMMEADLHPMEDDVVPTTSFSMISNNEIMGGCTVIIDGQEYAVVDADEAVEPTEVYEEINLPEENGSLIETNRDTQILQANREVSVSHHSSKDTLPIGNGNLVLSDAEGNLDFSGDHSRNNSNSDMCNVIRTVVINSPEGGEFQKSVVKISRSK